MKVSVSSHINLPPAEVWHLVQTPQLLLFIAAPLVRFAFLEPVPRTSFVSNARYRARLMLFGILPFGTQWIVPSVHEQGKAAWPKRLRDNGYSVLIERWDHWITVEPDGADTTRYTDEVEIRAGALTPFIWAFAQVFYRHRQRRWRLLAQINSPGHHELRRVIGLTKNEVQK